jgi:methionine biosynthesis protein MetW
MNKNLHHVVLELVPEQARVLDMGCGDGTLLHQLIEKKQCQGYGIEIDNHNVLACIHRGISVIQADLDQGLALMENKSFDIVLQINTLQNLRNTQALLKETARLGKKAIVAFPNFAHWKNRLAILRGRMPVTKALPYEWYDTPNIRVSTLKDFKTLAQKSGLRILDIFGLNHQGHVRFCPNLRAVTALFLLESMG